MNFSYYLQKVIAQLKKYDKPKVEVTDKYPGHDYVSIRHGLPPPERPSSESEGRILTEEDYISPVYYVIWDEPVGVTVGFSPKKISELTYSELTKEEFIEMQLSTDMLDVWEDAEEYEEWIEDMGFEIK